MLVGILTTIGCAVLVWLLIQSVKSNPALFSKENLNKSSMTLGILTLILIVVVGFVVMMLR